MTGPIHTERRAAILMFAVVVATVFVVEVTIMFLLPKNLSETVASLVDAGTLTIVLYPVLYYLVLRPMWANISKRLHAEQASMHYVKELRYKAFHDELTDLPNRNLLQEGFTHALHAARERAGSLALFVLDVTHLKQVNDVMGHEAGDRMLQETVMRLKEALPDSATVARLGGGEFAVLFPGMNRATAEQMAVYLLKVMGPPVTVLETPLNLETCIGIAIFPEHGENPHLLMRYADISMRLARDKHAGYMFYDRQQDPYSLRRLKLMGRLHQALERQEIILHYQPKINLKSGRIAGVEALARWAHPREGMVPPAEFMPLVEHSSLVGSFTLYVLEQALSQYRLWGQDGFSMNIAVNLSAHNLADTGLPQAVGRLLAKWRIPPGRVTLEVTETATMTDPERALALLSKFRDMGFRLSIDDFGTGYSSLAYLRRLPVHEIKIDKGFLADVKPGAGEPVILRSIIDLAHDLGLEVVAEGVESESLASVLAGLQCDYGQGFLWSRPIAAEHLAEAFVRETMWAPGMA